MVSFSASGGNFRDEGLIPIKPVPGTSNWLCQSATSLILIDIYSGLSIKNCVWRLASHYFLYHMDGQNNESLMIGRAQEILKSTLGEKALLPVFSSGSQSWHILVQFFIHNYITLVAPTCRATVLSRRDQFYPFTLGGQILGTCITALIAALWR